MTSKYFHDHDCDRGARQCRGLAVDASNINAEAFWKRTCPEPNTGCWLWTGPVDPPGYGVWGLRRSSPRQRTHAHRVAFALANGTTPATLYICHRCDTPACVNPDHLFAGTARDNTGDMLAKGRLVTPFGERNGHAVLTNAAVLALRKAASDGVPPKTLARTYGIARRTVNNILCGDNWKHIPLMPYRRANANAAKTHCLRAHEFTPSNTYINRRGARVCRSCRAYRALLRRPA